MTQPACCRTCAEHARRNIIQAAVFLVTLRYGDAAGEWLLAQFEPPPRTPAMFAEYREGVGDEITEDRKRERRARIDYDGDRF